MKKVIYNICLLKQEYQKPETVIYEMSERVYLMQASTNVQGSSGTTLEDLDSEDIDL